MGKRAQTLLIVAVAWALPAAALARCDDGRVALRGDWGAASFSVKVADDSAERAQGLMHVDSMPRFSGMLFVYEYPQRVGFWMRNTLIPLDMIFADSTGVVQKVHSNAVPGDESVIPGGDNIQYVLEINGGIAAILGISPGSQLQHPSVQQEQASWPCAEN